MNETFWNLFSERYTDNCSLWTHSEKNPVIPASGDTWKSRWTANPAFLELNENRFLYYRGNGIMPGTDSEYHDRIAAAEIQEIGPDIITIRDENSGLPVLDIGPPSSFEGRHVLDPSPVLFNDKVHLYYSAIGSGTESIALAVSDDGVSFQKKGKIKYGRAPSAVVKNEKISLLYQVKVDRGYHLKAAESFNGTDVIDLEDEPVFSPSGGSWDAISITTARLFFSKGYFYIFYGASTIHIDEPDYFGLARSRNLAEWERHPGNPIFGCGPKGSADGGAIWFPALLETETHFIMLYEGSRGKYSWDLSSQICMAYLEK